MKNGKNIALFLIAAVALLALPLLLQTQGNAWVRIVDIALLYVLLALGLNIVVGYAGLLDLGYVAFFAIGAYLFALLGSPHLTDTFPAIKAMFPNGLHMLAAARDPAGARAGRALRRAARRAHAQAARRLPGHRDAGLRRNHPRVPQHLDHPVNITNGPKGITAIDPVHFWGLNLGTPLKIGDYTISSVTLYYYLFLALVIVTVIISHRLQISRIGRAWMAIREDEIAAKAMGINTRNMKLLAFGMGASFGGVSGAMFAAFQGFVSPESFALMESVMIVAMVVLGGIGHLPGVILGAVLLAALPEVLRYVAGPLQAMTDGRLDASILRQLFIALAMIIIMLVRPRGLWPSPEHGKSLRAQGRGAPLSASPGRTRRASRPRPTKSRATPRVRCRSIRERGDARHD